MENYNLSFSGRQKCAFFLTPAHASEQDICNSPRVLWGREGVEAIYEDGVLYIQ
jgi:hypothetical protein